MEKQEERTAKNSTADAIEQRYISREYYSRLKEQKQIIEESFTAVKRQKTLLGADYKEIEQLYTDINTVYEAGDIEVVRKKKLLYRIYDAYFETLTRLSFRKRWKIRSDKYMKKMNQAIKSAPGSKESTDFWIRFVKTCGLPLVIAYGAELIFLFYWDTDKPAWIGITTFLTAIISLLIYCFLAADMESERAQISLKKWIGHKLSPEEYDKPMELMQYIKMLIPLGVAFASAMLKLYFNN